MLPWQLFLLGGGADDLGKEVEERSHRSAVVSQVLSDVREFEEAMIGMGKATFDPIER